MIKEKYTNIQKERKVVLFYNIFLLILGDYIASLLFHPQDSGVFWLMLFAMSINSEEVSINGNMKEPPVIVQEILHFHHVKLYNCLSYTAVSLCETKSVDLPMAILPPPNYLIFLNCISSYSIFFWLKSFMFSCIICHSFLCEPPRPSEKKFKATHCMIVRSLNMYFLSAYCVLSIMKGTEMEKTKTSTIRRWAFVGPGIEFVFSFPCHLTATQDVGNWIFS